MAYNNNYQQAPFWDFVRDMAQNGAGVDHTQEPFSGFGPGAHHPPPPPPPGAFPAGFPFGGWGGPRHHDFSGGFGGRGGFGGPGPHGRGGRRGRHCRREYSGDENEESRSRSRTASPSGDHPEGEPREGPADGPRRGGRHGRGRHGHPRSWEHGHHGHGPHGRRGPPPFGGPGGPGAFDLSGLLEALNSHPIAQQPWARWLRQYAQQAGFAVNGQRSGETLVPEDGENTFTPPIDVFSTETAYVLHIALPGAKKEDVGVNWDSDKGELNIAGVVYRQGDEEFLKTLTQTERKVGVFERVVKLPPGTEDKEEVNGDDISAKLEDGVLVVTVPKVEKEWTEVKKVDIN